LLEKSLYDFAKPALYRDRKVVPILPSLTSQRMAPEWEEIGHKLDPSIGLASRIATTHVAAIGPIHGKQVVNETAKGS